MLADNSSQINTVFYKGTGEIPDLQPKDKATQVTSGANECAITARASGAAQQQSTNKGVSRARQVPEETSL